MKHIDLFSGIGGFAFATDRVFGDVEHLFVEYDPFCQEVLKKHWPNSKIHGDIRTFTADAYNSRHIHRKSEIEPTERPYEAFGESVAGIEPPFILTGGFPCQPFSQAGRRKGTSDDRYLWPEMFRVIQDWKPTWVIAENVRGLITWNDGMVLEQVCSDLEGEGYEVQPLVIPAVAVNAPHRRDRVWFIAHARGGEHRGRGRQEGETEGVPGVSGKKGHIRGIGGTDKIHDVEDTISKRGGGRVESNGQILERKSPEIKDERPDWSRDWLEVATRLCRMDDGIPRRLDRNPRLKALGNAIVPQVAEEIMRSIVI